MSLNGIGLMTKYAAISEVAELLVQKLSSLKILRP